MKPTLDSLEAIAVERDLDLDIIMFKKGSMENIEERRETISLLTEKYRLLTGREYKFDKKRLEREYD